MNTLWRNYRLFRTIRGHIIRKAQPSISRRAITNGMKVSKASFYSLTVLIIPYIVALPGNFAVWAASPEASWLHGRFVWAHWDVDELRADKEFMKRLDRERGFLKVVVQGLEEVDFQALWDN